MNRSLTIAVVLAIGVLPVGLGATAFASQRSLWSEGGLFGRWQPADEIVQLRTECSKTFDNHDGTYSLLISGPLHRKDENDNWVDLPEAVVLAGGANPQVKPVPTFSVESTRIVGNGPGIDNHIWGADVPYFRCQYLYLSTELMFNGWITALGFFSDGDAAGGDTIMFASHWLKDTTATAFSSGAWDNPGTLTWGEGTLILPELEGWISLPMETPVMHVHGNSLLVSYYHQDGTVEASMWYRFHSTGEHRGKRGRSNSVNPPEQTIMTTAVDILITYIPVFPDIEPVTIIAPRDTVAYLANLAPQVVVRNNGPVPAIRYNVRLDVSNGYSNTQFRTELGIGAQTTVSFSNWTASPLGDFSVACSTMLDGDTMPDNNLITATGFVRLLDAQALTILSPGPLVDSGTAVTPSVRVRNNGNTTVSFPVLLTISGGYSNTVTATGLVPGEERVLDFPVWIARPRGNRTVTATTQLAGDQSSGNNTVSTTVMVRVLDVTPVAIVAPAATVDSGQSLVPTVRVHNPGNATVSCQVKLAIAPDYQQSVAVTNLAAAEYRNVTFPLWLPVLRGPATVRCSTELASDANPGNDLRTSTTFVAVRDVGASAIEAPVCSVPTGLLAPRCRLVNPGNIRSPVTAYYSIPELPGLEATLTLDAGLPVGAETTVVFPEIDIPAGDHLGRCSVAMAGDCEPANDVVEAAFFAGQIDVAARQIVSPGPVVDTAATVTPKVRVRNIGTLPTLVDAVLAIEQDGRTCYESRLTGVAIGADEEPTLVFDDWLPPRPIGYYTVRCSLAAAQDQNRANDTISGHFRVQVAMPTYGWSELQSLPAAPGANTVKDGGWLVFHPANGRVYALKGGKTVSFYSYNPLADSWTPRADFLLGPKGKVPARGAQGVTDGERYIYATKGNNTLEFYRYDALADSWQPLANVPAGGYKVKGGTDLAYVNWADTGYVYLLKGDKNEFYRFNTVTMRWENEPRAPASASEKYAKGSFLVSDGATAIYVHQAKFHRLYRYDVPTRTWSSDTLRGMPFVSRYFGRSKKSGEGAAGAWSGDGFYALKGGNTQEYYRYYVANDSWRELDTMPQWGRVTGKKRKVRAGGDLVWYEPGVLFALKGNRTLEFWRWMDWPETYASFRPSQDGVATSRPATADGRLTIGPNPLRSGKLLLTTGSFAGLATLSVYDAIGRRVLTQRLGQTTAGAMTVDLRSLPAGTYLVRLESARRSETRKLVIER